jgi:hypothetical protein
MDADGLGEIGRKVDMPGDASGRRQARQQTTLRPAGDQIGDEFAYVGQGAELLAIFDGFFALGWREPTKKNRLRRPMHTHPTAGARPGDFGQRRNFREESLGVHAHRQAAASADQAQLVERRMSRKVEHRRSGSGTFRRCL